MNKISFIFILLICIVSLGLLSSCKFNNNDFINGVKRTYYVGHRGSKEGKWVENTKESFIGSCKIGFDFLETDVSVTLDNEFICFHDYDLKRLTAYSTLKSNLSIKTSKLNDIKDITLSQKYKKSIATGKICKLSEYLEICNKYKVLPVIELKPAKGIYSSNTNADNFDYSNILPLLTLIKKYKLDSYAVILSEMRGVLNYIREVNKDIKLQYLARSEVLDYIDWAITNNISLDIKYPYCTKDIVDRMHENNLLVNIWTLNDKKLLNDYTKMGVDMITTDYKLFK